MAAPVTRYVKSDDVHIAYQVLGDGRQDVLFAPGFVSHVEALWQVPARSAFFRRLASFSRLILFDKRGTGMSDRGSQIFTLEQRMHDVSAILDEVGSERAALFGVSEGGPMSLLYAASYPERTSALILYGTYAKHSWAPDYPCGWTDERWDRFFDDLDRNWGNPQGSNLEMWAPSIAKDPNLAKSVASYFRTAASPGAAIAIMKMNREIDVRDILPVIRAPTLILHRTGDRLIDIGCARRMAQGIVGAQLIELPGIDHFYSVDGDAILDHIERFLTGKCHSQGRERTLATVLFADIVGSTERASALGDHAWRELLAAFHAKVQEILRNFNGREVNRAGDGFLAAFDGPARAVRCASAIRQAVRSLNLEVRCGVHTGECEVVGDDLAGIAVHIGARVAARALPGEVLVSQTVRDLVAGSGLKFAERGVHTLRGIPDEWRLFQAIVE
jgi:class 3 adenylate cyclase/pimeloyl-ACP methyl ester carboxylesterase